MLSAAMKCPTCQRNILTRRSGVCSFCGAALPAAFLLSPEQLQVIAAEERSAELKRKQRQERERQSSAGDTISGWDGGGFGGGDSGGGGGGD